VLAVPDAPPVRPTPYGVVARDRPGRIDGCRAVGFPRFKEVLRDGRRLRDSVQVDGYLPTAEGIVSGLDPVPLADDPRGEDVLEGQRRRAG